MQTRKTQEYWDQVVEDFNQSNKTQKEYADENHIKLPTLQYHIHRRKTSFQGFVEASTNSPIIPQGITDKPYIEVTYNKAKISIFSEFDEDLLLHVLRTVKKI